MNREQGQGNRHIIKTRRDRNQAGQILPLVLLFTLVFQLIVGYFLGQAVTNKRLMDYEEINVASDYLARSVFHYALVELRDNPDLRGLYQLDDYYGQIADKDLAPAGRKLVDVAVRVSYGDPYSESANPVGSGPDGGEGMIEMTDYQEMILNINFTYDDLDFIVQRRIKALIELNQMKVVTWTWRVGQI